MAWLFAVLAFACFIAAAAGWSLGRIQLGWAGLAILTLWVVLSSAPVAAG